MAPRLADWPPKFDGILFSALGPIQGHNVQHLIVTWGRLKSFFSISALTPGLKSPGLISTLALIGMLYLGWTLALTPNGKGALWSCHTLEVSLSYSELVTVKSLLWPHIERYLPLNPYVDADVEGEVSQSPLTLFLPPNLQNRKIFKKCQRWLCPVKNLRQLQWILCLDSLYSIIA